MSDCGLRIWGTQRRRELGFEMTTLLEKWLAHYDPIHRGWTLRGIANGVCATCGWCFPSVSGGYNLYRGSPGAESIDYGAPVGAADAAAEQIHSFAWRPHAPNMTYAYVVRAIGGGGVESESSDPPVTVETDAQGRPMGPRPNAPSQLSVRPVAGGAFVLRWTYSPFGEATAPAAFRVFTDGGTGTVNYVAVVGTVSYRRGQPHYAFQTGGHAHGVRRLWAVRAVSAEGRDDGNTGTVVGLADAEPPEAHPNPIVRVVEA